MKSLREVFEFEIHEDRSIARVLLSTLASPLNRFGRTWLSRADEIICISKRQRDIVSLRAPELSEKLQVIYNPPPRINRTEKRLGEPALLYLGEDGYIKGFHIILKTLKRLSKNKPNFKIILAGKYRESSINTLNSFKNLEVTGPLSHREALKLHKRAHALIFLSIAEEPLPYVVIEAMLSGTIPIASRVGRVSEIVEGTYAEKTLFEPYDIDEVIDKIELMLAISKEQIIDIGLSLRETALRKFNPDSIKEKLREAFSL